MLIDTHTHLDDARYEPDREAMIARAREAGVDTMITIGCDLATSRSAELLDLPDRGVIAPGRLADLLVVEGDPTQDLSALSKVRMVVKSGEVVFAGR